MRLNEFTEQNMSEGAEEGDLYAMALQRYPHLKQVDQETVITALNNAYEDFLMHYGYEGIGPDEESRMIDHAVKGLKPGVAEGSDIDTDIENLKYAIRFETPRSVPGEDHRAQYARHAEKIAGYKAELKKLVAQKKQQGVTEGAMPLSPTPQGQERGEKAQAKRKADSKAQFLKKKEKQGVSEGQLDEFQFNPTGLVASAIRWAVNNPALLAAVGAASFAGATAATGGLAALGPLISAVASTQGAVGLLTIDKLTAMIQQNPSQAEGYIKKLIYQYIGDESDVREFEQLHAQTAYKGETEFRWRAEEWPVTIDKNAAERWLEKNDRYWLDAYNKEQADKEQQTAQPANATQESLRMSEGVAETLPLNDALKLLRQYGADHFKTTSNELHFYKNGRPFSVDLVMNPDTTRSVTLTSLNSARRGLTGQGVAEGNYDDNRTGFSRGPRDDERHDLDVPRPTIYALKINGKIWQKDGNVVTFFTKERALAARNSILNKRPELEVGLVQRQD